MTSLNSNDTEENNNSSNNSKISFQKTSSITIDENKLFEIKDQQVLERIATIIPDTIQFITNTELAQNGIYQAILPAGEKLARSKDVNVKEAFRGFSLGDKGIKHHANLINKSGIAITNAIMSVASIVVGQYYMNQINKQLGDINDKLNEISGFQDSEYRGKIGALITEIKTCSYYKTEISENDDLRTRTLDSLKEREHECAQLLEQANIKMKSFNTHPCEKFSEYEKLVPKTLIWFQCQRLLLNIMKQISELTYTLYLGEVSAEFCRSTYLTYAKQAEDALIILQNWHLKIIDKFKINLTSKIRLRKGAEKWGRLAALILIPESSLLTGHFYYSKVSEELSSMILKLFSDTELQNVIFDEDLFSKDVSLIAKDGKIYYMLE